MTLTTVAVRNIWRNKLRTVLTVAGVALAIFFFIVLRTIVWSWTSAVQHSAKDRIATRHKISFVMPLPKRYAEEIAEVPGVTSVATANWFGAVDPRDEKDFFATIAVDTKTIFTVYDEIKVAPAEKQAFLEDRRGAIIGDSLAKKKGWKVGDKVTLRGTIYPGDWEFFVRGIYTSTSSAVDRATLYFHYEYLNESLDARRKDNIGWIVARISDPGASGRISKQIDTMFEDRDQQTITMSEAALQQSFLGMFSAVLKAMDIVSVVLVAIMALILGNTIAMGVRERTHEYGVLRAIGFLPKHIAQFIVGEATVIGIIGGLVGVAISYPMINQVLGRFVVENMGNIFPQFRVEPNIVAIALGLAVALAILGSTIPARQAARLKVVEALRRVG